MPNRLNAAILFSGLAAQLHLSGWEGLGDGLLGVLVGFALMLGPFALHLYRGGDAKLVMALGAWLGPSACTWMFLWGVSLGGLLGLILMISSGSELRRRIGQNLKLAALPLQLPRVEAGRATSAHVPMALAFSSGAVLAATWWR